MKLAVSSEQVGTELQGEIAATHSKAVIGRLRFADYADYRGGRCCRIEWIEVEPTHRREGVAAAMCEALREHLPGSEVAQLLTNAAGRALEGKLAHLKRPRVAA